MACNSLSWAVWPVLAAVQFWQIVKHKKLILENSREQKVGKGLYHTIHSDKPGLGNFLLVKICGAVILVMK